VHFPETVVKRQVKAVVGQGSGSVQGAYDVSQRYRLEAAEDTVHIRFEFGNRPVPV
jgi:hypothetical protein